MDVDFGLLGPLEVRAGEWRPAIRSPKDRTLLATLLLKPRAYVSVEELAETIWGWDQPAHPRRAVHLIVHRVRAMLGAAGAGRLIATVNGGYLADVRTERVDVGRFHQSVREADRAASRSDVDGEWAALDAAVGQWRGEPLADIPSDKLRREYATGLAEQNLLAVERRIDVGLRQGRQAELLAELLAELAQLTSRHPLRERLWAQLMTALIRSGRRAAALEAYHTARRHLADELDLEPGPDLRRLHTQARRSPHAR